MLSSGPVYYKVLQSHTVECKVILRSTELMDSAKKEVNVSFLLEVVRTPQTRISWLAGHSPFPLCALYSSEAIWGLEGGGPSGAICRLINVRGLINAVVGAPCITKYYKAILWSAK